MTLDFEALTARSGRIAIEVEFTSASGHSTGDFAVAGIIVYPAPQITCGSSSWIALPEAWFQKFAPCGYGRRAAMQYDSNCSRPGTMRLFTAHEAHADGRLRAEVLVSHSSSPFGPKLRY